MDIASWLRGLGLERYERSFLDNDIGADLLPALTSADLRDLGVESLGHRKRLLAAIAALSDPDIAATRPVAESPAAPPPSGTPAAAAAPAERRHLSVLFCDLVGSVDLAARLDPEELGEVIQRYQEVCGEVVSRWGGHVSELLGDGVLAYFGHPRADEDDAERAVRAGLALVEAVAAPAPPGRPALRARIGIATGLVVVGGAGGAAAGSRERAAVGGAPNVAARLQALAEPGTVVIDAATSRLVSGLFEFVDLGPLAAKGLPEPVRACRVLRPSAAVGSRSEALHASAAAAPAPLVGRDEEVELLRRRWVQASAGEGRVVLLSGEPGIGKSRLAAGLWERLAAEPNVVRLQYFCSPHNLDTPLHPWMSQLARAARFGRRDPPAARVAKLQALLARSPTRADEVALVADLLGLAGAPGCPPLPDLSPHRRREALLHALVAQLASLSARQPVLMLVEDAHWADPTSLELLGMGIERWRRLRALLVITHRPEFRPPWAGLPQVTALALGGIERREAAALVAKTAGAGGHGALPDAVVEEIVERAGGVPLFVEELTRAVVEAQAGEGGGGAVGGALASWPAQGFAVPAALHAPLMARLDRLGPAREVAQVGAAIGQEFTYELLAAVSGRPGAELRAALDRLVEAGLVYRTGEPPHAHYAFKHTLVHDAAYGTLLLARRRELHAAVVRALAELVPEEAEARPELLARHCAQAGLKEEACGHWRRAGKRAIARSAMAEAAAHLRRALEALAAVPGAETPEWRRRELELLLELGVALTAVHGYTAPETGRLYERARALCERLGDVPRLVEVVGGQCSYHFMRAEVRAGLATAEDLLDRSERAGSVEGRIMAHRLAGMGVLHSGRLEEALGRFEAAAALLRAAGGRAAELAGGKDALVAVPAYAAITLGLLGRYGEARGQAALALAEADRFARPHRYAFALALLLCFHALLDEDAPRLLAALERIGLEHGFPYWKGHARMFRGLTVARAGRAEEGIALVREGAALHDAAGAAWAVPCLLGAVAGLARTKDAPGLVEEAFRRIAGTGVRFFEPELHRIRGVLRADRGDTAGAEADYAEAIRIAREQGAKHWELRTACSLARLRRDGGRTAEARAILAPIHGVFVEDARSPDLGEAKALLAELA